MPRQRNPSLGSPSPFTKLHLAVLECISLLCYQPRICLFSSVLWIQHRETNDPADSKMGARLAIGASRSGLHTQKGSSCLYRFVLTYTLTILVGLKGELATNVDPSEPSLLPQPTVTFHLREMVKIASNPLNGIPSIRNGGIFTVRWW